jgi:hypothetical protein
MAVLEGNKQDMLMEPTLPQMHENQSFEGAHQNDSLIFRSLVINKFECENNLI